MMNGDEGGQLSDFIGGDPVLMRGDIRLIGGIPPVPPLGKTLKLPNNYIISWNWSLNSVSFTSILKFLHLMYNTKIF